MIERDRLELRVGGRSWGTVTVLLDGLQQQVDEHAQLLGQTARQEAQHDGEAGGGAGLALGLAASLAAHAPVQDPAGSKVTAVATLKQRHDS